MKTVYVDKSLIEGRGMFVGQNVVPGEVICFIKGSVRRKVNDGAADSLANPNWIGIGPNTWIDPSAPFTFINHSCNPSASIRGRVTLVALRALSAGEEITIDYSLTEEDPLWHMACSCGAENCRGLIRAIDSLPLDCFVAYLPNVPTHFKTVYLRTRVPLDEA